MDYFVSRRQSFLRTFKWITLSVGDSHSYIGMQISVRNGIVTLDMRYYLGKILECCEKPRVATVTPRGKDTFSVDSSSRGLVEAGKKRCKTSVPVEAGKAKHHCCSRFLVHEGKASYGGR